MARSLTLSSIADKNKIASDVAWIFALEIDVIDPTNGNHIEYLRVCRNDEALTISGNAYQPLWFDIDISDNEGELPSITVTLQDQSQTIMYYLQTYQGGVGFGVNILVIPIQQGNVTGTEEPDLTEFFKVISTSSDSGSYTTTWTLGAENPLTLLFPKRQQMKDRCAFVYKGPECGYNGGLGTCERTLTACQDHGNEANYGGFPALKVGTVT